MTEIITVAAPKSGVGKTTAAVMLAHGLALEGNRVLLMDFDRGQAAMALGVDPGPNVFDFFTGVAELGSVQCGTGRDGLALLPGNRETWAINADSVPVVEQIAQVRDGGDFDYLVIDTAHDGGLQAAAIFVADTVVVPVRCDALGMVGLTAMIEVVGKDVPQVLILPTFHEPGSNSRNYNLGVLRGVFPGRVLPPVISTRVVAEAHAAGCTIWECCEVEGLWAAYRAVVAAVTASADEILFGEVAL